MSFAKVAKVVSNDEVVINKGANDGVKPGQSFIIYAIGEEIVDPDTEEVLEALEIVRGTGKVTHVQDKIAYLKSDMKAPANRTIRKKMPTFGITGLFGPEEIVETIPSNTLCFSDPEVGDLVRRI
jgi:hypothetical protein